MTAPALARLVLTSLDEEEVVIPDDLDARVRAYFAEHPDEPWEDAVRHVADSAP
jgi:hypothetical protein